MAITVKKKFSKKPARSAAKGRSAKGAAKKNAAKSKQTAKGSRNKTLSTAQKPKRSIRGAAAPSARAKKTKPKAKPRSRGPNVPGIRVRRDIRGAEAISDTSMGGAILGGELDIGAGSGSGDVGLGPGEGASRVPDDRDDPIMGPGGIDETAAKMATKYADEKERRPPNIVRGEPNRETDDAPGNDEDRESSMLKDFKKSFDREGRNQSTHPQGDRYEDLINDAGQDVEDQIAAEENQFDFPTREKLPEDEDPLAPDPTLTIPRNG